MWADARELCFISKKIIFDIDRRREVWMSSSRYLCGKERVHWSNQTHVEIILLEQRMFGWCIVMHWWFLRESSLACPWRERLIKSKSCLMNSIRTQNIHRNTMWMHRPSVKYIRITNDIPLAQRLVLSREKERKYMIDHSCS